MAEWVPKSAVPVDTTEWMPASARTPVKAHSRAVRRRPEGVAKAIGEGLPAVLGATGGALGGTAGAAAGGIGALPGAAVGAMGGGAAGAVLRNALYAGLGLDPTGGTSPPIEGAIQGGYEAFGPVPGTVLKGAGRGLMRMAAKMTPEVAEAAAREGIPVTMGGVRKALGLLGRLGAEKRVALVVAGRKGWRQNSEDLANEAYARVRGEIASAPEAERMLVQLDDLRGSFVRSRGRKLRPSQVEAMRSSADDIARPIRQRAEKFAPTDDATLAVRVKWNEALADIGRERLNLIPEVGLLNRRMSRVIAVKDAVAQATQFGKGQGVKERLLARSAAPTIGFGAGMLAAPEQSTVKTRAAMGVSGALAGATITSPQVLSYLALAAGNPLLAQTLGRIPRAAGWAGSSVLP